jgi:hypothetical protein
VLWLSDFVGFDVGSFFPELLCLLKVDLLSRFDCTLVRYTPRNENFVLVLEGISRAKPLAS